ncbi:MAG: methionine synthase [Planctomycetota bacterium]|nr:methionine synthase [Planctomycetota bacterium]
MSTIREIIEKRVLVLDGAMGTQIHAAELDLEKDFLGLENCSEIVNVTRPDVIGAIHGRYFAAGCDAVETNTFGGSIPTLAEFDLADRCFEINEAAAKCARAAADEYSTPEQPRFVFGSMGPGTKLATLGQATYADLKAGDLEQARGLAAGGVDAFLVETCQDPLQVKAALNAAIQAREEAGRDIFLQVSVTMEVTGTMLVGTEMAAAIAIFDAFPIDLLSLNCATGPREMGEHIRLLGQTCRSKIGVYPNAGLPQLVNGETVYPLTPEELADWLHRFVTEDGVNLVGGCCGTTPEHLEAIARRVKGVKPKARKPGFSPQVASVYSAVNLIQENSILLVGERSNANGSKAFREHLLAGDLDKMVQMGRDQLRAGSHVLDLCTAYVGRDEVADMSGAIARYRTDVAIPLMIDSTETPVLKAALELCGGRSIINSINLEDGLQKCVDVLPLAKEHGAAVVCLTIDEDGMAKTADEKVRIARRIHDICVDDYGMRPEDLLFDVLTFTICTGNEDDRKLGAETLEGIRRVREELPGVGCILGLSNISFGLKPAARHALNSVYMHHAQAAGMTAAILHAGRIEPLHHIDAEVRKVCDDLIFDNRSEGYDPLHRLMELFENVDVAAQKEEHIPTELFERLKWRIIEGERNGLDADLEAARIQKAPLDIINTDLLGGMAVVGELFGSGEMQLPFVLQSAETMKAAVALLEPFMERDESSARGSMVLATVRGDVHDIGKNLVDIILTNNGYTVYNLGIKQPIQHILDVAAEQRPDAIGMSGLLVKSTVIMRENLQEMNARGVKTPVLLGGAALNRKYVEHDCRKSYEGALYYARDAFDALDIMARIKAGEPVPGPMELAEHLEDKPETVPAEPKQEEQPKELPPGPARDISYPEAPFLGSRLVEEIPLNSIAPFINERTLFQFQWGYRRKGKGREEHQKFVDAEVRPVFRQLIKQCSEERILDPKAVYGFWKCVPEGDSLLLLDPNDEGKEAARFKFPRQSGKKNLCISDFFHRRTDEAGNFQPDVIGLQAVTVGDHATEVAMEWFQADRYQDYLHLHGFTVETAEGLAEYIHREVRAGLGIVSDDAREMRAMLAQGYRGSRYSFGYPACPNLADQEILLDLLGADRINLRLGDEDQLWPEQSTSAIVCHHPEARYFTI